MTDIERASLLDLAMFGPVSHTRCRVLWVHLPKGEVSHIGIRPANRERIRCERPEDSGITRPRKPSLAFEAVRTLALGCTSPLAERQCQ
jgi:hypothetical protein